MIEAAGGVIWKSNAKGQLLVLIVHRQRYDDWTFPKGKLTPGESSRKGAQRETLEETGLHCAFGPPLPDVRYADRKGRAKRVKYWAMHVVAGQFAPNREVDQVSWVTPSVAAKRLSYGHDLPVLAALVDLSAAQRLAS